MSYLLFFIFFLQYLVLYLSLYIVSRTMIEQPDFKQANERLIWDGHVRGIP